MSVIDEILAERGCGIVHCGVSRLVQCDLLLLANEFGLHGNCFVEIAAADACSLLTSVLHKDMAYDLPLMTEVRAQQLAGAFVTSFGDGARFFSNGWPDRWQPATDATFDTGVLVIGEASAGCLWVQDED